MCCAMKSYKKILSQRKGSVRVQGRILFCVSLFILSILFPGISSQGQVFPYPTNPTLPKGQPPKRPDNVYTSTKSVVTVSWWDSDPTDQTQAIQAALDSRAQTVIIPYVGKKWIVRPITVVGNQEIIFEPGVVVTANKGAFKGPRDCLFLAQDVSNVTFRGYGATLMMRKSDYQSDEYEDTGFRHVIGLRGASDIKILGLRLASSGGDGICLNRGAKKQPCTNILIRDCFCDDNYRQGLSIVSGNGVWIENSVFSGTKGTAPSAGIDVEPYLFEDVVANIVIRNCIARNNAGSGFIASVSNLSVKSHDISILFDNCYAINCSESGLRVRAVNNNRRPRGKIEFRNCICEDISYPGAWIQFEKVDSSLQIIYRNCKFKNVSRWRSQNPIGLSLLKKKPTQQFGQIEFIDCFVFDKMDRPFLAIKDEKGRQGIYDIKGSFTVVNSHGEKNDAQIRDKVPFITTRYLNPQ